MFDEDALPPDARRCIRGFLASVAVDQDDIDAVEWLLPQLPLEEATAFARALGDSSIEDGSAVVRLATRHSSHKGAQLSWLFVRYGRENRRRMQEVLSLANDPNLAALLRGLAAWPRDAAATIFDEWDATDPPMPAMTLAALVAEEATRDSHLWPCDLCRIKRTAACDAAMLRRVVRSGADNENNNGGGNNSNSRNGKGKDPAPTATFVDMWTSPEEAPFGVKLTDAVIAPIWKGVTRAAAAGSSVAGGAGGHAGQLTYAGRNFDLRRLCTGCRAEVRRFLTVLGNDTELWHVPAARRRGLRTAIRNLELFKAEMLRREHLGRQAGALLGAVCAANAAAASHDRRAVREARRAAAATEAARDVAKAREADARSVAAGAAADAAIRARLPGAVKAAARRRGQLAALRTERRYGQADGDHATPDRRGPRSTLPADFVAAPVFAAAPAGASDPAAASRVAAAVTAAAAAAVISAAGFAAGSASAGVAAVAGDPAGAARTAAVSTATSPATATAAVAASDAQRDLFGTPVTVAGVEEVMGLPPSPPLRPSVDEIDLLRSMRAEAMAVGASMNARIAEAELEFRRTAFEARRVQLAAWRARAADADAEHERRVETAAAAAARRAAERQWAREERDRRQAAAAIEAAQLAAEAAAAAAAVAAALRLEREREEREAAAMHREEAVQCGRGDRFWGVIAEAARLRQLEVARWEEWERRVKGMRLELATMGCTRLAPIGSGPPPLDPHIAARLEALSHL